MERVPMEGSAAAGLQADRAARRGAPVTHARRRLALDGTAKYWLFILPALAVILSIVLFPWLFTIWMSVNEWSPGAPPSYVGWRNYAELFTSSRFAESMVRTFYFTILAVVLPVIFGTFSAVVLHRNFPLRGLMRGIFILPMMATPVAISLVWTMMFHPQLGVLNYLLTSVGLPSSQWVYSTATVIPTLVMVEVWHWTPLVMLIVLGGLSQLPRDPYEAAEIDGAGYWTQFRFITVPLIWPFLMIALIIRTIDALKTFDTIFVITQGGPGIASETISIHLYLQAFAFHHVGYASALVVVFFAIIVATALLLLYLRQRVKWS
jgi:multiple sugar transport system permease protein